LATPVTAFDLEDPRDLARLTDPMLALRELHGLVVLDEVQRRPEIFSVLRVLADRSPSWRDTATVGNGQGQLVHYWRQDDPKVR
jgi:predicted AAA+ superfamily ATPase